MSYRIIILVVVGWLSAGLRSAAAEEPQVGPHNTDQLQGGQFEELYFSKTDPGTADIVVVPVNRSDKRMARVKKVPTILQETSFSGKKRVDNVVDQDKSFKVVGVYQDSDGEPDVVYLYQIHYKTKAVSSDWLNACKDSRFAIAVDGYWGEQANHILDGKSITFSCLDGAIAECLRIKNTLPIWNVNVFDACTRMLRADYLGDGKSHTKRGTRIEPFLYRITTPPTAVPTPAGKRSAFFEALWTPSGAYCVSMARWMSAVVDFKKDDSGQLRIAGILLGDLLKRSKNRNLGSLWDEDQPIPVKYKDSEDTCSVIIANNQGGNVVLGNHADLHIDIPYPFKQ